MVRFQAATGNQGRIDAGRTLCRRYPPALGRVSEDVAWAPLTKVKKQELLRAFFGYCLDHEWTKTNPAKSLSKVTVDDVPTDYFRPDEFAKIIAACDTYPTKSEHPEIRRQKVKSLALLMRWS